MNYLGRAFIASFLAAGVALAGQPAAAVPPTTAPATSPTTTPTTTPTTGAAPSKAGNVELSAALIKRIESRAAELMKSRGIPGMTVAVGRGDGVVWTKGFGVADVEQNVPATEESVYRLASISKPLTAIAALWLVEQGKIDLKAEVRSLVPEFPDKGASITLDLLLRHQGGIRHYRAGEVESTVHYVDSIAPLSIFKDDPLVGPPGAQFLYSTYGYVLAGAMLERAAHRPLMEIIAEATGGSGGGAGGGSGGGSSDRALRIMADNQRAIIPHRVRGYQRLKDGTLENCELADTSNKIPGGGMCASPAAVVQIAMDLANGKILTLDSLKTMWTPVATSDGKPQTYALGWQVTLVQDKLRVSHSGSQPGTSTSLVLYPDEKLAVAVFCNLENAPAVAFSNEIAVQVMR